MPHSRWNDVPLAALVSRGYLILTQAMKAGADLFVKTCGESLFVFLQGHPEYDARALMREYRRDVLRFLTGERTDHPTLPAHYFDHVTESQLRALRERALATRDQRIMIDVQGIVRKADLVPIWKPAAVQLYRNWLNILVPQRARHLAHVV